MAGLRIFLWLLVAYQVGLFYWLQVGTIGRNLAACLLLVGLLPQKSFSLPRTVHTGVLVLSAIAFGMQGVSQLLALGVYAMFAVMAEYLVLVQALELLHKPRPTTANYVPGLSVLSLAMLLLSLETPLTLQITGNVVLVFILLLVCVMRSDVFQLWLAGGKQRQKSQLLVLMFAAALCVGGLFQQELRQDLPQLRQVFDGLRSRGSEQFAERIFTRSKASLLDRVSLGSIAQIQRQHPNELVFSVEAAFTPGYMRTTAFVSFDGKQWRNPQNSRSRGGQASFRVLAPSTAMPLPQTELPELENDMSLFELTGEIGGSLRKLIVEVLPDRGSLIPLPAHSAYLFGEIGQGRRALLLDSHRGILPTGFSNTRYGVIQCQSVVEVADGDYLESLLEVPAEEQQLLRQLSDQICQGISSTQQKIGAIENYFRTNFRYSLEAIPDANLRGRSRLNAFLTERRDAHCEYFATATALLLRSQGIPCRLAGGYLVYEMNNEREYYAAQNKNAHAWVEAYDELKQTWLTVEATPSIPEYIASHQVSESESEGSTENGSAGRENFSLLTMLQGWYAVLSENWNSFVRSRYAWTLPVALLAIFIALRFRKSSLRARGTVVPVSKEVRRADSLARKIGYHRAASETCNQFADRLQNSHAQLIPLAQWYRDYAVARFCEAAKPSSPIPRIRKRSLKK